MKVAIIGAGNMGGAIARGLANGHYIQAQEISVSNPSAGKLDALKAEFPAIHVRIPIKKRQKMRTLSLLPSSRGKWKKC